MNFGSGLTGCPSIFLGMVSLSNRRRGQKKSLSPGDLDPVGHEPLPINVWAQFPPLMLPIRVRLLYFTPWLRAFEMRHR